MSFDGLAADNPTHGGIASQNLAARLESLAEVGGNVKVFEAG